MIAVIFVIIVGLIDPMAAPVGQPYICYSGDCA